MMKTSDQSNGCPFSEDQLYVIRDALADWINPKSSDSEDCLSIINVCQRLLDCPEYSSVDEFINNVSGTWTEIVLEENDNYD